MNLNIQTIWELAKAHPIAALAAIGALAYYLNRDTIGDKAKTLVSTIKSFIPASGGEDCLSTLRLKATGLKGEKRNAVLDALDTVDQGLSDETTTE